MTIGSRIQPTRGLPRVLKFGEGPKKPFSEERYQKDPAIVEAKAALEDEEQIWPPGIDPDDPITAQLLEEMAEKKKRDKRYGKNRFKHNSNL
jgi:hypothetical protein